MRRCLLTSLFLMFLSNLSAQLPNGSTAPDFTTTDIDGTSHNLYSLLDQGYTVYLDFMATWCPPCWSYHNSGAMKNLYNLYGPSGTDEIRCFMIEADPSTPVAALYGNGGGTIGNWVQGTPYPIADDAALGDLYAIAYYPTIYAICPDRTIYEVGQLSTSGLYDHHQNMCALDYTVISVEDENCYHSSDGSIQLRAEGNSGNETFAWSNGITGPLATGLTSGNYTCTITDGNRQVVTDPIQINGPATPLEFDIWTNVTNVTCAGGSTGSIQVEITGGTPPYFYHWQDGTSGNMRFQLEAGVYSVNVMDFNGCAIDRSFIVEEPLPIKIIEVQIEPENCGQSDGVISINAEGGTGPLTYELNGVGNIDNVFTELEAGDYTITIIDQNNCIKEENITLEKADGPDIFIASPGQLTCIDTIIALTGTSSPGSDNILFSWSTDEGTIVGEEKSDSIKVGAPGIYYLKVIDESTGCSVLDSVEVKANLDLPQIDILIDSILTCNHSTVTLDAGHAINYGPNFEFGWYDENGKFLSESLTFEASEEGYYTFMVINYDNGCAASRSVEVIAEYNFPQSGFYFEQVDFDLALFNDVHGNPDNYLWTASNGWTSTIPNPTLPLIDNGQLEICLMIENECGTDEYCKTINVDLTGKVVDKKEVEFQPGIPGEGEGRENREVSGSMGISPISVYPNPTSRLIKLNTQIPIRGLELFEINGRQISLPGDVFSQGMEVDISGLPDGVYLLRVSTDFGIINKRIIKIVK